MPKKDLTPLFQRENRNKYFAEQFREQFANPQQSFREQFSNPLQSFKKSETMKQQSNNTRPSGTQPVGMVKIQKSNTGSSGNKSSNTQSSAQKKQEEQRKAAAEAYKKAMNQQLSGLSGAYSASKSAIDVLLGSLDPKYQKYKEDYQKTMEENKLKDINEIAARTAAYGTSDSEQAAQMKERQQNEYAKQFSDYLSSMQAQKEQERLGYQTQLSDLLSQYEKNRGDIQAQRTLDTQASNEKFQQLIDAAAQQDYENNLRLSNAGAGNARIGVQNTGINPKQAAFFNRANQLKTQLNGAWDKVANVLMQEGYDVTQGDYRNWLDSVMLGKPMSRPMYDASNSDLSQLSDEELLNLMQGGGYGL